MSPRSWIARGSMRDSGHRLSLHVGGEEGRATAEGLEIVVVVRRFGCCDAREDPGVRAAGLPVIATSKDASGLDLPDGDDSILAWAAIELRVKSAVGSERPPC